MDCKQRLSKSVKIDERSVKEQEHRKASRLWSKVIQKQSTTTLETLDSEDEGKRGAYFRGKPPLPTERDYGIECQNELSKSTELSGPALQRKMAKMKTFAKRKSPLQKFDEIVTRELISRQYAEDESICPFDDSQKMSNLDFSCSKISTSGRRVSFDTKISKTTLHNVEMELKNQDMDPSDVENAALMDAIEKLIQAQASCRFDAAVKAAEAAASSVPPEMAEEVAIRCAKEYQSEIIDIVNEKVAGGDGRRPMEVIGYIGITKMKDVPDEE